MTNGRLIDPFPELEDSAGDQHIDAGSDILESPNVDDIKEKIQNDTFIHTEYENYDVRTHLEKRENRWTSTFSVSRNGRKLEDGEFAESPFRQSPEESKSEKGTVSPDWEETYLVQAAVKHQELCRRVVAHIKSEKEAIKKKKRKKWIIATAACLLIAAFACIAIYKNRQQSVKNIKLDITFQFQKPGETPSIPYPVDSPEISNITLTHKDNYWLNITSRMDGGNLFLYIFQMDQLKKVNILFPNLNYGQVTNPISGI